MEILTLTENIYVKRFESYDTLIAQTKVPMVRGNSCKLFIDKEI